MINIIFIFIFSVNDYSVKEVKFSGQFTIERSIILKIMMLEANQRYSKKELDERIKLLKNSGLFFKVEQDIEQNLYIISLDEKTTISAFIHYNTSSNLSKLSFGIQDRNVFNQYLLLATHFDYVDSKLSKTLWIEYPFIFKNFDLLLNLYQHDVPDFYYRNNQSYKMQIKRFGIKSGLRYHFNQNISFEAEFEHFVEDYIFNDDFPLDNARNQRFNFEKMSYHFSSHYSDIEKSFYSINGLQVSNYYKYFEHIEDPSYTNNLLSLSYFNTKNKLTFASRLMLGASGKSNYLYPFTSDGLSTIRASKFNEKRGQYSFINNIESRFVFQDENSYYLQAVAFIDYAFLYTKDENMFNKMNSKNSSISSYGLGLRFELKKWYNAILRLDFPIRDGNLEVLFGVGQFF